MKSNSQLLITSPPAKVKTKLKVRKYREELLV